MDKNTDKHQQEKKIFSGSTKVVGGKVLGKGFRFILDLFLASFFGPAIYGIYGLTITIVNISRQLSLAGFQNVFVKFYPLYKSNEKYGYIQGVIWTCLLFTLVSSIIMAVFLYLVSDWLSLRIFTEPRLGQTLRIFVWVLPFNVLLAVVTTFVQGVQKMGFYSLLSSPLLPGINLIAAGSVVLLSGDFMDLFQAFLLGGIAACIVAIYFSFQLIPSEIWKPSPKFEVRRIFRFSAPLSMAGFANMLLTQVDRLMVGFYLSSSQVGIYMMVVVLALQVFFVLSAFNITFSPIISELYSEGKMDELEKRYESVTRYILGITLVGVLPLILFSANILQLIKPVYTSGAVPLSILAFGFLLSTTVGSAGYLLQLTDNQIVVLVNHISLLLVNITLNIVLIPMFGILGAAIATSTSVVLVNIVRLCEVYYFLRIHPYSRSSIKYVLAFGTSIGIGVLLKPNVTMNSSIYLWLIFLLLVICYYITFVLMWGLEPDESALISSLPYVPSALVSRFER